MSSTGKPEPLPAAVDATNTMPVPALLVDEEEEEDASSYDDGDGDDASYVPSSDGDDALSSDNDE